MRFLRNRFITKFLSVFFFLLILESIFQPTISYALTTGPHQPEYISYEEPGATDMVNLLTGDFSLSLPILEVPGPEGGFSIPLTYNAGIGPDQEASWVGLGWTLNAGAITRSVVQYPDDASGEVQSVHSVDLTGVRGWTSRALGLGQIGWNNQIGQYGALSLFGIVNASYNSQGLTVGVVGINVGPSGVSSDGAQFMMAAISIATMGTGTAGEFAGQSALNVGVGAGLSYASANQTPNAYNDGYRQYSKRTSSGFLGIWEDYWIWLDQTRYEEMFGVLNFDQATLQPHVQPNWHGIRTVSLNLNLNGTDEDIQQYFKTGASQGSASDISYIIPEDSLYVNATGPVVLATDNFSVKAPGISGSVKPYRLDVSSVSMPREMGPSHSRLAYLPPSSYKVPFIYEGDNSNSYFYQVGSADSVAIPGFYSGLSYNAWEEETADDDEQRPYIGYLSNNLDDIVFQNRIREDLSIKNKIPMNNHIEWLTNGEIANTSDEFNSGFMDYFSGYDRSQFREAFSFGPPKLIYSSTDDFSNRRINIHQDELIYFSVSQSISIDITAFDSTFFTNDSGITSHYTASTTVTNVHDGGTNGPWYIDVADYSSSSSVGTQYCELVVNAGGPKMTKSIGGYSITDVKGLTYHFALPSYEYGNFTKIRDKNNPTTMYTEIKRDEPFASTWLLTGITGSDFVDRGGEDNGPNGVIDSNDWGHWVKFNYGKYTDDYQWSIPFNDSTIDAANTSFTSSTGHKQMYYLNSIETRSHVALFIKDTRDDNLGTNIGSVTNSGLSLRLSDIYLLKKEVYDTLFLSTGSGGFGMTSDQGLTNLTKLWMSSDFPSSGTYQPRLAYINQNAIKRIKFTYTYDLCPDTPNSVASGQGKLTLTRVSMIGKNGIALMPDYKFDYGNSNPSYNANSWDGWGMFTPSGTSAFDSHQASHSDADGSAWSISKITNPLGSTIDIAYERDDYSLVSGNVPYEIPYAIDNSAYTLTHTHRGELMVANPSQYSVGDFVNISGSVTYSCTGSSPYTTDAFSGTYQISSVDSYRINLGTDFRNPTANSCDAPISTLYIQSEYGSITKIDKRKKGGNIRVSSLTLKDQNMQMKTRYLYVLDNGNSSGVVAQEPDYIKLSNESFYDIPGYPFTPVMYSKVTVLSGALINDSDYHTKQVYEFETPNVNLVSLTSTPGDYEQVWHNEHSSSDLEVNDPSRYTYSYVRNIQNGIADSTSRIGKIKSIKTYDGSDLLVSSAEMNYTSKLLTKDALTGIIENKYQGIYSESTLMFDRIGIQGGSGLNTYYDYNKISRTTILKYPYELTKVVNSKDGFTSETENKAWDFISGLVVEKIDQSPLGLRSRSITKLAYSAYSKMGSKAINSNNKNMLAQEGANYSYRIDGSGNIIGLLAGTVQTWRGDWNNYRYVNGSNVYADGDGGDTIWRKHKSYVYKGSFADLRTDGTATLNFSSSNEFDFGSGADNTGWQQTGEVTRYDHYSSAIEGKDLNSIYSSSKKDITGRRSLASASNATYHEFTYSGAEDWSDSGSGLYLGGEVAKGDGSAVSGAHTGVVAVQVTSGNKTFEYKPASLTGNRVYRVSVWTNSTNGAIYYVLNGGSEQTVAPVSTQQVGGWYQINAEIPIGTFTSLEVGVKSTSGTVSFDDFRFQPRDGSLTANIYDPVTGVVNFALDNRNMFTKYEYNDRGQLIKTYSESFKYGIKLVTENKMNYKRFNTNQ